MTTATAKQTAIGHLDALRRAARAGNWDAVDTASDKIPQWSGEGAGNVALAIIEAGCAVLIQQLEDETGDGEDDELDGEAE